MHPELSSTPPFVHPHRLPPVDMVHQSSGRGQIRMQLMPLHRPAARTTIVCVESFTPCFGFLTRPCTAARQNFPKSEWPVRCRRTNFYGTLNWGSSLLRKISAKCQREVGHKCANDEANDSQAKLPHSMAARSRDHSHKACRQPKPFKIREKWRDRKIDKI